MLNGKIKPAHYFFLINIVKCDKYTSDPAVIHPTKGKTYCFFYIILKTEELDDLKKIQLLLFIMEIQ